MKINIFDTKKEMGKSAGRAAEKIIKSAIDERREAHILLATGVTQFELLEYLAESDIDWKKVDVFHMDEYIGLPYSHHASLRKYLKERFHDRLKDLRSFHYINGEAEDPSSECRRIGDIIRKIHIDVACIGVGVNGHIAFNDPPADFENEEPFLVVSLDEACRGQQLNEGWFTSINDVPKKAISMSIRQIMKSRYIICSASDDRKTKILKHAIEGKVTDLIPASILQTHQRCIYFLDKKAAGDLEVKETAT